MEDLDPEITKHLKWLLNNDIGDGSLLDINFTYSQQLLGTNKCQTIELIENGSNIEVNESNKKDFIKLLCRAKMTDHVDK